MSANAKQTQILDFWAPHCAPCRQFKPKWEAWAEKYGDRADFIAFDTSDDADGTDAALFFKVSAIPTVIVLQNGEEVERIVGVPSLAKLAPYLKKTN